MLQVTVPALSYPAPKTPTVPPLDPELGERTICGTTLKLGVTVTPAEYVVVLTLIVYPPEYHTEVAPTLNLAVSCPELSTVQISPVVSKTSTPEVTGTKPHPVSLAGNPVPVTVTSVAGAPGEPLTGGEPVVGVRVAVGTTVRVTVPESP